MEPTPSPSAHVRQSRQRLLSALFPSYSTKKQSPISNAAPADVHIVLILLNRPITPTGLLSRLWPHAEFVICADGGSNHLYDASKVDTLNTEPLIPHAIVGDGDSIRPDVRAFYEGKGVHLVLDAQDQDSTDFQKCLEYVRTSSHPLNLPRFVVALGALDGRLDHTMSALSTLYAYLPTEKKVTEESGARAQIAGVTLLSDTSCASVLAAGEHVVTCDLTWQGPSVGLLPLGIGSVEAETHGLKWELRGTAGPRMRWGEFVSTSNTFSQEALQHAQDDLVCVSVATSKPLLWTVEVKLRR